MTVEWIRLLHADIDEIEIKGEKKEVFRGVIAPESLPLLKLDVYQREAKPVTSLTKIIQGLRKGVVPDITLGCRTGMFEERKDGVWIKGPVFVIDGQRRRDGARHLCEHGTTVHLGCLVHFNTTYEWESELFRDANTTQSKASPNIILRNERDRNLALATLYGLTFNESKFALYKRVTWKQTASTNELVAAITLTKVSGLLHQHHAVGFKTNVIDLMGAVQRQAEAVTLPVWRRNIVTFFDVIDECWGVRKVVYRGTAPQIKSAFLRAISVTLGKHPEFWGGPRDQILIITPIMQKKIKKFSVSDPFISGLASGATDSKKTLEHFLEEHFRKNRITLTEWEFPEDEESEEEAA